MIHEIEVINGHHVVDMQPNTIDTTDQPIEIFIEVLKCMTGVKLIELGAEGMGDLRKWKENGSDEKEKKGLEGGAVNDQTTATRHIGRTAEASTQRERQAAQGAYWEG